jgi:hypothetical protein
MAGVTRPPEQLLTYKPAEFPDIFVKPVFDRGYVLIGNRL